MAQPKVKSEMKDQMLSEESVVSEVSELMETLDHIKKYYALSGSLKKFSLIVIGSIAISLAVGILWQSQVFNMCQGALKVFSSVCCCFLLL